MRFPWDTEIKVKDNQVLALTGGSLEFGSTYLTSPDLKYEIKHYPDGSQYVIVHTGTQLTFRVNDYNDLWTLAQINDVLVRQKRKISLCIPNLIDAQADRRFAPNQPAGLKVVCQFLNSMQGFSQIQIFHPHNAEVVEALIDNVNILDNYFFISKVLEELKETDENLEQNLILMSSDAGGFKPLMKLADKLQWDGETYSASKARKFEEGHTHLTQIVDREDFGGKDVLIVDDLCIYGGTFKGLAKLLKEKNCGKIYLAVSHLTVEELGQDPVTDYFDKVYTTNSKFDTYFGRDSFELEPKDLTVIELF
jgi:ribose-phosphate pyrophosphokinase